MASRGTLPEAGNEISLTDANFEVLQIHDYNGSQGSDGAYTYRIKVKAGYIWFESFSAVPDGIASLPVNSADTKCAKLGSSKFADSFFTIESDCTDLNTTEANSFGDGDEYHNLKLEVANFAKAKWFEQAPNLFDVSKTSVQAVNLEDNKVLTTPACY